MKTPYRTILLSAFALTSILTPISASDDGLRLGARAGATAPILSYDFYANIHMGLGAGGGLALQYPLTERLGINTEISFYHRVLGSFADQGYLFDDSFAELSVLWMDMAISVPIMVRYEPNASGPFYIAGGIQLEYIFNAKNEVEFIVDDQPMIDNELVDLTKYRATVDIGIALGLGYMIRPNFGIDFRYVINVNRPYDETTGSKSSLMAFGAGLTYYFLRL